MLLKFDHLKVFSIIFFLMTFSFFPRQLGIEMQNTSDFMIEIWMKEKGFFFNISPCSYFFLFHPIIAYGNVNI
jgi:hypothetical protein